MLIIWLMLGTEARAQGFALQTESDSLSWLVLTTDGGTDRWQLPHPVYQFQVGDVDGDGTPDAMVGVVKNTRFHRDIGRRLFIFKQVRSRAVQGGETPSAVIRPMWMGSKLGGRLVDFRFIDAQSTGDHTPTVRALEATDDDRYFVADYQWEEFGLSFVRFIATDIPQKTIAYEKFLDNSTPAD